jgi:glycerophosphoryl diester phosphodiesterase
MLITDDLPLIIAHRGASTRAPENTIASFREAINAGADGIEFDVRLAQDGVPVVIHDPTLSRTGRISGNVSDMTSAELGQTDVASWFNDAYPSKDVPDFRGETVPTLAATLDYLKDYSGRLYVELKCSDNEIERLSRAVAGVIEDSLLMPNIIVKSFRLGVIPYFRMCCPYVKTAALFAPKVMRILRKEKYLVKIAEEFGADHLSIHYSLATRKLMKRVEKNGVPVTIWTADNPRWVKRAMKLRLNAIITNDPARLLARRKELL